ncbi:MAG: glycosyltransferase family 1 protein [Alistipes sp.]
MDTKDSPCRLSIGFDAKRASVNYTGLGNYSRFIIDAVAYFHPEFKLTLYIPSIPVNALYSPLKDYPQLAETLPGYSRWSFICSLWRTFGIATEAAQDKIDIYHGLSNELPVGLAKRGMKSIVTIHDLIFLHYPEFYKPVDRIIYKWKFCYACRTANRIIAVSECTKRDIIRFFKIDPDKIEVIYQGCSSVFQIEVSEEEKARVKAKYQLPDRFLFSVGSIEPRKNILLGVKALESLPEDIHFVAIGRRTAYVDEIEAYTAGHQLSSRVHLFHQVEAEDLPIIYHMAHIFIYPSRYEGFGIPIIEAISAGLPVIAATGSCLEEAGGDACIYISPDDEKALAEAVLKISADPELQKQMVTRSQAYIQRFDKKRVADQVAALYQRVAREE